MENVIIKNTGLLGEVKHIDTFDTKEVLNDPLEVLELNESDFDVVSVKEIKPQPNVVDGAVITVAAKNYPLPEEFIIASISGGGDPTIFEIYNQLQKAIQ